DRAQDVVRRRQRTLHRPAHPGRARCKHDAFKNEQDAYTDEEVGKRNGPHRMTTSRSIFVDSSTARQPRRLAPVNSQGTLQLLFSWLRRRRDGRGSARALRGRLARGIAEEAEETRFRPEQEAGVAALQAVLIR